MSIPKQIKYLSIIFFLNAGIAIIIGGLSLTSLILSALDKEASKNMFSNEIFPIISHFSLNIQVTIISIIFLILLGINLRKLKPWARNVTLGYSLFTIFFTIINQFTGDQNISIGLFIQVYAIWVLFRPDVKEAFGVKLNYR
jgi:hypothetical protein